MEKEKKSHIVKENQQKTLDVRTKSYPTVRAAALRFKKGCGYPEAALRNSSFHKLRDLSDEKQSVLCVTRTDLGKANQIISAKKRLDWII